MSSLTYRPDIDGLRSVAILPVVLFHLGLPLFSGGFVGVDIFFVISGFLITSIILHEIHNGSFSMQQFWVRRIRRILPAMFVLITCTLAAGWWLLAPHDYAELGKSARYQALFAANIYFWQDSGYFDTASDMKPLLHMWSLAVEEQFYFFFPLLLLLLKPVSRHRQMLALCAIALASLGLSAWTIHHYPTATFYLLPMRAWELLAGSIIAFLPAATSASPARHLASISGMVAILVSIFLYDSHIPFPGPSALLPTLGAAAIIWAGPHTPVARLLATRPAIFIGLISYSWYLWHWPLIVYTRYWQGDELGYLQQGILFFASLALAYASYRLVENPFRQRRLLATNRKIISAAICCIVATVIIGQQIRVNEGFPDRLPEAAQQYESARHRDKSAKRCENVSADDIRAGKFCKLGPATDQPALVSWGDSHSGALLPLYETFANEQGVSLWHSSMIACSPLTTAENSHKQPCIDYNQAMLEFIRNHHVPHVLLASRWPMYLYGEKGNDGQVFKVPANLSPEIYYRQLLENLVQSIRNLGAEVWIIKQVPTHPFEPPKHLAMLAMQGKPTSGLGRSHAEHLEINRVTNGFIDDIAGKDEGLHVLDATDILCQEGVCRTELDGISLYRDDNHLTPTGALFIRAMLQPLTDYLSGNVSGETGAEQ